MLLAVSAHWDVALTDLVLYLLPSPHKNFYKSEVNKEDMYIRYIHKLCDLHLQAEDFTGEAQFRPAPAV